FSWVDTRAQAYAQASMVMPKCPVEMGASSHSSFISNIKDHFRNQNIDKARFSRKPGKSCPFYRAVESDRKFS
ncbi:hypothetical protein, partial [Rhodovulum sulfidophilum]|uniref:hypothetical protein n=1 Tax=Rhodovulum sulfidophilum TaxID=35806 RepID=UPI001C4CA565